MRIRSYLGVRDVAASFFYAVCGIVAILATIWLLLMAYWALTDTLIALFPPGGRPVQLVPLHPTAMQPTRASSAVRGRPTAHPSVRS